MTHKEDIPHTLVLSDILAPVTRTHKQVDEITQAHVKADSIAVDDDDKSFIAVTNRGMFVLALSSLEVMIQDVQVCILQGFPLKMADSKVEVRQMLDSVLVSDVLHSRATQYVRDVMYKDTKGVLEQFEKITGIDVLAFRQDQINSLIEMKETRNALLHNGLKANDFYIQKSGPNCRVRRSGEELSMDSVYLGDCLVTIKYFINEIGEELRNKYGSYTRVAALKRLWDFMMFQPDITPFEEYWEIDLETDLIRMKENPEYERRMSSTERHFLTIWRNLFVGLGAPAYTREFSLTGFDEMSRRKTAILLEVSRRFGVLANR